MESMFYVDYENTPFLQTSQIAAHPNRLNWRAEILLTRNKEAIKGKKILDLGSHDGRFSYACLKLGASHVTGVEFLHPWVESARENLIGLGYKKEHFTFIEADVFNYLPKVKPKEFDTILCFGFMYGTYRQIELLNEVKRIQPTYFILDTNIARGIFIVHTQLRKYIIPIEKLLRFILRSSTPKILWRADDLGGFPHTETAYLVFRKTHRTGQKDTIHIPEWGAWPTIAFIDMALKSYGFSIRPLYWNKKEIGNWNGLWDYKRGLRRSYIAQLLEQ